MLLDIRSQPAAIAEGLPSLRRQMRDLLPLDPPGRIVLTGSGDSLIAALAIQSLFRERCEAEVLAVPSLDASRYLDHRRDDLIVVASVSGGVTRSLEVAHRARAAGCTTIAITANGASPLAETCGRTLVIPPPIDRTIPHSRDYSVTLLAFACLLEGLAGVSLPALDGLADAHASLIERSFASVESLARSRSAGRTWFLGAGPDRATAMFGALKFWEAAGMEAWWDDLEEFGHGSQLMARPGDRVVLIASGLGVRRAIEIVPGLEAMGTEVVLAGQDAIRVDGRPWLSTDAGFDGPWHPFVACVPLQVLTYVEATALRLEVSVPLFGKPHGLAYDEVHTEWTQRGEIMLDGREPAS